jgi:hypothetical protein
MPRGRRSEVADWNWSITLARKRLGVAAGMAVGLTWTIAVFA